MLTNYEKLKQDLNQMRGIVVPYHASVEELDSNTNLCELLESVVEDIDVPNTGAEESLNDLTQEIVNPLKQTLEQREPLIMKLYVCKHCPKAYRKKYVLEHHIESIHLGIKGFQCETCDFRTAYKSSFDQHMRIHTKEKPYKCRYCEKSFTISSTLIEHKRIHTNSKPHKCEWCSKPFSSKSNYNKHIRIHTLERPFNCAYCDKTFNHSTHRNRHVERMHEDKVNPVNSVKQKLPCPICDKMFTRKDHLNDHIKLAHYGIPKYRCKFCEKGFANLGHMRHHQSQHSLE